MQDHENSYFFITKRVYTCLYFIHFFGFTFDNFVYVLRVNIGLMK